MIKFGTGGWRAVIADEFTKANIRLVVAGLCGLMKAEGLEGTEVCVGYDRRFLSKEACHWVAEVLAGYGYKPLVVNRSSPTPLIMFTVKQYNLPYGMAVTASHNPAIYNGIKVFTAGGRDADKTVTNEIEAEIAKVDPAAIPEVDYDVALEQGKIREIYPFNEYIDSILQFLDVEKIKASRLRIAVDPMYGVSQSSLRTILMTCRCDVDVIHDQHDTLFGGKMPAPSAYIASAEQLCGGQPLQSGPGHRRRRGPPGRHRRGGQLPAPEYPACAAVLLSAQVPELDRPLCPEQFHHPPAGPGGGGFRREVL